MTNGGGIHHTAKKKAKTKTNQNKSTTKHKPAKAMMTKGISGQAS